jgi:hypothetical protein
MNTIDLQASVNNLTQVDRHQQDLHRAPMANQVQNTAAAAQEAAQRTTMPTQAEQTEGKVIDPNNRKEEKRRREKKKAVSRRGPRQDPASKTGYFVDLNA